VTLLVAIACGGRTRHQPPPGSGGEAGGPGTGATSGSGGRAGGSGASAEGGEAGVETGGLGGDAGGASGGTAAGGSSNAGSSGTESSAGTDSAGGHGGTGDAGTSGSGAGAAGLAGGGMAGMATRDPNWATWPIPNPVGSGLPNPHSYTELEDGTVRDNVTGMVWQKLEESPEVTGDWEAARSACELLDGDWRLPSIIELASLLDVTSRSDYDPIFERLASLNIWSSTELGDDPTLAFSTYDGATFGFAKATKLRRGVCVRAGLTRSGPHYESVDISGISAVRDNFTGLVWQQGFSESKIPFQDAAGYCEALGEGFRAPSAKELYSLVDHRRSPPKIDDAYFPSTPSDRFWSRDPYNGTIVWVVGFKLGELSTYGDAANWVRCVR
jgi:hypothetical protein